ARPGRRPLGRHRARPRPAAPGRRGRIHPVATDVKRRVPYPAIAHPSWLGSALAFLIGVRVEDGDDGGLTSVLVRRGGAPFGAGAVFIAVLDNCVSNRRLGSFFLGRVEPWTIGSAR